MSAAALLGELSRVAAGVAAALPPAGSERLLSSLAETARRLLGAHACSLALVSDDGRELVYTTAAGAGASAVTGMRLPLDAGIAGWVVQSGQPLAVSDVRTDPRFAPDVARSTGYTPTALLAVPVVSDERVLGVLSVLDRDADRPGAEDDLLLLQVFCDQAAIALEAERTSRRIGELLLDALSAAAGQGTDLAEQLRGLPGADDDPVLRIAGQLASLVRHGPDVLELAVRLVGAVVEHAEIREGSRPAG